MTTEADDRAEPLGLPPVASDAERADLGLLPRWPFRAVPGRAAKNELRCFCDRPAAYYVLGAEAGDPVVAFCFKHARNF